MYNTYDRYGVHSVCTDMFHDSVLPRLVACFCFSVRTFFEEKSDAVCQKKRKKRKKNRQTTTYVQVHTVQRHVSTFFFVRRLAALRRPFAAEHAVHKIPSNIIMYHIAYRLVCNMYI